jgi:hypothetical protein
VIAAGGTAKIDEERQGDALMAFALRWSVLLDRASANGG